MRFLFILLLILISSCSLAPIYHEELSFSPVTPKVVYLTPDEIANEFQASLVVKGLEYLATPPIGFIDSTTPIDEFFPSNITKNIDRKRSYKGITPPISYHGKGHVDLRSKDTLIVDQWNGTCTAHGLTAAIENFIGVPSRKLSERHVWDGYEKYSCDKAIEYWSNQNRCITVDQAWPHGNRYPFASYKDQRNCFTTLLSSTYIEDDIQKMIDALDINHPVYIGMSTTKSFSKCDPVMAPESKATGKGHAIAIVGYHLDSKISGGGYFIIKNSWGMNCGDHGYQYVPFSYCTRKDLYCAMWTIDAVESNVNQ